MHTLHFIGFPLVNLMECALDITDDGLEIGLGVYLVGLGLFLVGLGEYLDPGEGLGVYLDTWAELALESAIIPACTG